ncbi:MAG: PLP-dependent aminotransferase family protein [Propionibacteriaceae bacterium]
MLPNQFSDLLPLSEAVPAYLGLAHGIRGMVMDGRLATGSRLPSERALAETLGLSRTTITRSFGELVDTGWAVARRGSGTTVRLPVAGRAPSLSLVPTLHDDTIDLRAAAGLAPEGTGEIVRRALEWLPSTLAGAGYEPYGAVHLRERIADRYTARGVPTHADQIIVTSGAVMAISVAMHALLRPGERVVVDSPTYPGALNAMGTVRARAVPVALDAGWDVRAWAVAVRRARPHVAYLVPDFHNPTGLLMPTAHREELARLLHDAGCVTIVDETVAELDFGEAGPERPSAAVDGDVVCIGSTSKVLWGGFRIGWLRCPDQLVDTFRRQAESLSLGPSALDQLVVTTFLEDPAPIRDAVVDRLRRARTVWQSALADRLPDWRVPNPPGGLALWVTLPTRLSTELALAGRAHGIAVAPGPTFSPDHTHTNRVRLPLTLPLEVINDATERLAAAWVAAQEGRRATTKVDALAL